MNFTVAIPTFNDDPEIFRRVLDLVAERAPGVPVVVVDMSTDDRVKRVAEGRQGVLYHAYPESGGVSHSRNRCLELVQTRHAAFLDSDAYPDPGWLEPLAARLAEDRVAIAGSKILAAWEEPPPRLMHSVTASDWLSLFDLGDEPLDIPRIMGTSYAVDRERLPDPPFDESSGRRPGWPLAMEENILSDAVRDAGWRVVYAPGSVVRHNIPADRSSWRWMWKRAHAAGRETRMAGRFEPIPRPPMTLRDHAFRAAVAIPFMLGAAQRPRERDQAETARS